MAHTVSVTQRITTSTTTSTAILLNVGYLKTFPGILKLLQLLICCACVGIIAHYFGYYRDRMEYTRLFVPELFFLLISAACLIATGCIIISSILSLNTAMLLPKTYFEIFYHVTGFLLLLSSAVTLLVYLTQNDRYNRPMNYEAEVAASVLGLINSALFLFAAILAYRKNLSA